MFPARRGRAGGAEHCRHPPCIAPKDTPPPAPRAPAASPGWLPPSPRQERFSPLLGPGGLKRTPRTEGPGAPRTCPPGRGRAGRRRRLPHPIPSGTKPSPRSLRKLHRGTPPKPPPHRRLAPSAAALPQPVGAFPQTPRFRPKERGKACRARHGTGTGTSGTPGRPCIPPSPPPHLPRQPAALPASHRRTIQPRTCPSIFPLSPAALASDRQAGAPRGGGRDHAAGRRERPRGRPRPARPQPPPAAASPRSRPGWRRGAVPCGSASLRSSPATGCRLPRRPGWGGKKRLAGPPPRLVRPRRQAGTARRRGWGRRAPSRGRRGGRRGFPKLFPPSCGQRRVSVARCHRGVAGAFPGLRPLRHVSLRLLQPPRPERRAAPGSPRRVCGGRCAGPVPAYNFSSKLLKMSTPSTYPPPVNQMYALGNESRLFQF